MANETRLTFEKSKNYACYGVSQIGCPLAMKLHTSTLEFRGLRGLFGLGGGVVNKFLRVGIVLQGALLGVFAFAGTASAGSIGLVDEGACEVYGDVSFCDRDLRSAGTGVIDPFLRVGRDGSQKDGTPDTYSSGWNTDAIKQDLDDPPANDYDFSWSSALAVGDIGYVGDSAVFTVDINQKKNDERYLSLTHFELFSCSTPDYTSLSECTSFFDLFADGDWVNFDYSIHTGSGAGDIDIYIPSSYFTGLTGYVALLDGWGCGIAGLTCDASSPETGLFKDNDGFQEWIRTGGNLETSTSDIPSTTTDDIPEPALLTLLGAGLVAAGRRLRRRTT